MSGRMVQIDDLIKELSDTRAQFGNTCVYIRDVSWGAVAMSRKAEDDRRKTHKDCGCKRSEGSCICDDPDFK
jgi:hypothetical protein